MARSGLAWLTVCPPIGQSPSLGPVFVRMRMRLRTSFSLLHGHPAQNVFIYLQVSYKSWKGSNKLERFCTETSHFYPGGERKSPFTHFSAFSEVHNFHVQNEWKTLCACACHPYSLHCCDNFCVFFANLKERLTYSTVPSVRLSIRSSDTYHLRLSLLPD